jgi:hypothetical protein
MLEQHSRRTISTGWSLAPGALIALLAATLLAGSLIGAAITSQVTGAAVGAATTVVAPAPTFDAVRFRQEEREPLGH